jgi:hypothetical protein
MVLTSLPGFISKIMVLTCLLTACAGPTTATIAPITLQAETPQPDLTPSPQPSSTVTSTPKPTATETPTVIHSPTATQRAAIPAEWQAYIDHTEELPDGRVVAIAAPTVDGQDAVRRVLQLNENGEWIPYVPETYYTIEKFHQVAFPNLEAHLPLPAENIARIHFNEDEAQPEVPLGYLGRTFADPEHSVWTDWLGGIVVGLDEFPQGTENLREIAVQVPLPNGDQIIMFYRVSDFSRGGTRIFSLDTLGSGFEGQTETDAGLNNTVSPDFVIRQSQIYRYLNEHPEALIGQQVVVGLTSGVDGADMPYGENDLNLRQARDVAIRFFTENEPVVDQPGLGGMSFLDGVILPVEVIEAVLGR